MHVRPQCETTAQIEKLNSQPLVELKKQWAEIYASNPPKDARKDYLVRGIAYKIQEQ